MTLQPSPCPFCGGGASIYASSDHSTAWEGGCANEQCKVNPSVWELTKAEAVEAWNRRAALASQAQPEQPKQDSFHLTSDAVVCAATALKAAVAAIYFDDSSDYCSALWEVVRALSPEMADLLEKNPQAAYHKADAGCGADNASPMSDKKESVAALPEGWVAVPREPTLEMVQAGYEAIFIDVKRSDGMKAARKWYRAVLAARPSPSTSEVMFNGMTAEETAATASVMGLVSAALPPPPADQGEQQ